MAIIAILLTACSPSQGSIQTAIAQTQVAEIPSYTDTTSPLVHPTSTISPPVLPTLTITPLNTEKEREFEITTFLNGVIIDPRYDPSNQVLEKYIDNIEVDIEDNALHFHVYPNPNNPDDAISLAIELIQAGVLVSHSGKSNDWKLGIVDVNYPLDSETCGISLYVNGEYNLEQIYQNKVSVSEIMELFECELNDSTLPIPTVSPKNISTQAITETIEPESQCKRNKYDVMDIYDPLEIMIDEYTVYKFKDQSSVFIFNYLDTENYGKYLEIYDDGKCAVRIEAAFIGTYPQRESETKTFFDFISTSLDATLTFTEIEKANAWIIHLTESNFLMEVNGLEKISEKYHLSDNDELPTIEVGAVLSDIQTDTVIYTLEIVLEDKAPPEPFSNCSELGASSIGDIVICEIPKAICTYNPDGPYPATQCDDGTFRYILNVFGEDVISKISGECLVIVGRLEMYDGSYFMRTTLDRDEIRICS
jgi:hypothetical protein